MADFSALIAQIEAYVKLNGNNEITGNGLQDILVAMVGAIGGALNDAVSDLESADTTLTNAIGDEELARQGGDNTLGGRITAEEEARAGADTGLQNQINGINGKIPDTASGTNKLADKAFVQGLVDALTASIAAINDKIPSEASSSNKLADKAFVQALTTALQNALDTLNGKVPAAATSENQLADKAFVTSLTTALQNAINAINTNIGNGFVYAGVATPSGTPVSGKVAYLTAQEGTYTNYGDLFVPAGISVIKYDGTDWSQEQVISMETIYRNPLMGLYDCDTSGSTAAKTVTAVGYVLPTSGGSMTVRMANHTTVDGVTLEINGTGAKDLYYKGKAAGINNTWDDGAVLNVIYDSTNDRYLSYNANAGTGDGVFDVSEYTGDDYATLEDAIADIPVSEQHGGMEMRFVRSSDNNYVQYFLTKDEWSENPADWEKMNIESLLLKNYRCSEIKNNYYQNSSTGQEVNNSGYFIAKGIVVKGYEKIDITRPCLVTDTSLGIYFYKEDGTPINGQSLSVSAMTTVTVPTDAYSANISFNKTVFAALEYFEFHPYPAKSTYDLDSKIDSLKVYDISGNSGKSYTSLLLALADVPVSYQVAGVSVKFIHSQYHVVKVSDATEVPTGAIALDLGINSGDYTYTQIAAISGMQVSNIPTMPETGVVFYTGSDTYTIWTVTLLSNGQADYVEAQFHGNTWTTDIRQWSILSTSAKDYFRIKILPLNFSDNHYVSTIGNYTSSNNASCTAPLNVKAGDVFHLEIPDGQSIDSTMSVISEVIDSEYYNLLGAGEIIGNTYYYVFQKDCKAVFSQGNLNTQYCRLYRYKTNTDTSHDIDRLKRIHLQTFTPTETRSLYIVRNTRKIGSTANNYFLYTYKVTERTLFRIVYVRSSTSHGALSGNIGRTKGEISVGTFVDMNYIVPTGTGSKGDVYLTIEAGETLVVGCENKDYIRVYKEDYSVKPTEYDGGDMSAFTKILCIGDSLTQGVFNFDPIQGETFTPNPLYSYPSNLKRISGSDVTNLGVAGVTSAGWYAAYSSQPELIKGHDCCIIFLGVNDDESTLETVTKPALMNIINLVKTNNKQIKIFLSSMMKAKTYSNETKDTFLKTFYHDEYENDTQVFLLDMWNYSHIGDLPNTTGITYQLDNYNMGHLSAYGYWRLAKDYFNYISWIMSQNTDGTNIFRNIQFTGTDFSFDG